MSNTLLLKRSSTPNTAPAVGNIALGELAINTFDGRLYTKIDTGTPSVFELTQNQPITVTGNVTGTSINGVGNTNIDLTLTSTGVAAGTYGGTSGASSNVGVFTVDQYGRITSASNVTISTSSLANGTSNIQIFNNGNITISPSGTSNVAVFADTGEYITGLISASGNITGSNFDTAGLITATGNVTGGNVLTSGYVTATGNLTGGNINTAGLITATGNLTVANVNTGGLITATGNIIGGNLNTAGLISATGNISGGNLSGTNIVGTLTTAAQTNITSVGVLNGLTVASTIYADGYSARTGSDLPITVLGANANIKITPNGTGVTDFSAKPIANASSITATGNIVGGNITTGGLITAVGNITATANIAGGNISTAGNVATGGILTDNYYYANGSPVDFQQAAGSNTQLQFNNNNDFGASVNLTFDSATNILTVGGTSSTTGNVIGGNVNTAGLVSATGNVTGGNINTAGLVSATGNVRAGNLVTAAAGNVVLGNAVSIITQTGSNATINLSGSITLSPDTAASGTNGVVIGGSGYLLAPNGARNAALNYGGGSGTLGIYTINVYGNTATAITNGGANGVGNIGAPTGRFNTFYGLTLDVASNVTGGNINTAGLVSATGNLIGGNVNTGGLISATGNITGGNISTVGNVTTGGIKTDNYYYANGAPVDFQQPAGANTQIQFNSNGDFGASANFTFNTTSNVLVVNATANVGNTNVTGYVSATGNLTGSNINTGGLITATGNITGSNFNTLGLVSAAGNVTGGNLNTAGSLSVTGNANVGNLGISGAISTSGNIGAANFNTTGLVTATGNVTGGNINTTGAVVTPNVTSSTGGLTVSTASGDLNLYPTTGNIVVNSYINGLLTPQQATDAATKQYVDNAVSAGITIHPPVYVESPEANGNLPSTYADGGTTQTVTTITGSKTLTFATSPALTVNDVIVFSSTANGLTAGTPYFVYSTNGSNQVTLSAAYDGVEITTLTNGTGLSIGSRANSGVGATLTNSGANAALTIDGYLMTVGKRVLIYNQTNAYENGVYVVTTVGDGSTPWVLTRASDANRYGPKSTSELDVGDYFFVQVGDTGGGESYVVTSPNGVIVFGTTAIGFTQFSDAQVYTANTAAGLSLDGTEFNAKIDGITTAFDGGGNIIVKASAQLTTPNIGAATGTSLSVTANVTGGNINTAGLITATGNITGGNINTAGAISTTANVVGGNINTGGLVSVTGNVIGGNLVTAGLANVATLSVSNWANIIGNTVSTSTTTGALKVAGGVGVVGNIFAGSLYSGGEAVLTINSTIDGGTY